MYTFSPKQKLRKAAIISTLWEWRFFFAVIANKNLLVWGFTTSAKVSKWSTLSRCSNSPAIHRAFYRLMLPLISRFLLKAHFAVKTCWSIGRSTSFQVPFSIKASYSLCITAFHSLASGLRIASLRLVKSGVERFPLGGIQIKSWDAWGGVLVKV